MANGVNWLAVARAGALFTRELSAQSSPVGGGQGGMAAVPAHTASGAPTKSRTALPAPGRDCAGWIVKAPHVGG
jgi:hypothetical protein